VHLKIGILGEQVGWKYLLQQIGIPHIGVTNTLLPDEFSAVVVSDTINDRESEMLRQYLALGGAVLCSVKVYARIRQTTAQSAYVNYLSPTNDSPLRSIGIIDVQTQCQLAWNANDLKTNKGSLGAYIGTRSKDCIIALPFDPASLVFDCRSGIKSFYSPEHRLPFETVSIVSKGEIRRLVSCCLELLYHQRGLPYVHLWHFPHGSRSIFCFRIDTDYGTREQLEGLSSTIHRNGISATWFVDTKSQEQSMKIYKEMHGQEIGVHCYDHQTFPDYERNIQNIKKAQAVLHRAKLEAKGFAAPFGLWNEELGRALVECGFEYSSEFSYDYDDLPILTWLERGDSVLQVPIHPICIGSLKRHGYNDTQMIRYFESVIQRKLTMREPMVIYHHPRDEHHTVLEWLFHEVRQARVPVTTMHEYAQWWKMRTSAFPEIRYTKGNIHLRGVQRDRSLYLRITQPNGTEAIIPTSKQITLEAVRWDSKPESWIMPDDYLRERRPNYRINLIRGLDAVTNLIRRKKT
jgi:hypothetical protein